MAHMNQEKKSKLAPAIRMVLKKYGMRGSISVENHNSINVNIKSGKLDLIKNYNETLKNSPEWEKYKNRGILASEYIQVNEYHYKKYFTGKCLKFIDEMITAMNDGNYNHSDYQSDYFSVGWYTHLNIGHWNKPYTVEN